MAGFLTWIVVGGVAGWLAGVITSTNRNIIGDLVLGVVGAVVAGWITDLSVGGDGLIWTVVVAAVFAAVLVLIKDFVFNRG